MRRRGRSAARVSCVQRALIANRVCPGSENFQCAVTSTESSASVQPVRARRRSPRAFAAAGRRARPRARRRSPRASARSVPDASPGRCAGERGGVSRRAGRAGLARRRLVPAGGSCGPCVAAAARRGGRVVRAARASAPGPRGARKRARPAGRAGREGRGERARVTGGRRRRPAWPPPGSPGSASRRCRRPAAGHRTSCR